MGSQEDAVLVTLDDLDALQRLAVQEAKLEILVDDFKEHKKNAEKHYTAIDKNIAEMFTLIRTTIPDKMEGCRDQIETDIHLELEKHYATDKTLRVIESELNNKIDKNNNRYKWTVGAIVAVGGAIQFFTTMWFMSLQISKLSGGG